MANNNNTLLLLGLAGVAIYFFTKKKKLKSRVVVDNPQVLTAQQYYQPIRSSSGNSTIQTISNLISSGKDLISAIKGAGGTNINVQPAPAPSSSGGGSLQSNSPGAYHHGVDDDIVGAIGKKVSFFADGKTYVIHLRQ